MEEGLVGDRLSQPRGDAFTFPVAAQTGMSTMFLDDVIRSLVAYTNARRTQLTQHAYNLHAFTFKAQELAEKITTKWPQAKITFDPNPKVDALITGWPDLIEDAHARGDWGWAPAYAFDGCFDALVKLIKN